MCAKVKSRMDELEQVGEENRMPLDSLRIAGSGVVRKPNKGIDNNNYSFLVFKTDDKELY